MFQAGRDIEAMSQDLSRWMGAVSDVDNAHKSAKNPSMLRKVFGGGSVEQEAIEAFTAKKKLEEQRYELKQFLISPTEARHGTICLQWKGRYAREDRKKYMTSKCLERKL